MVNWDSSFTSGDAQQRSSGEPLAWHEAQAPIFATRLVREEKLCGPVELEKMRKQLKAQAEQLVAGRTDAGHAFRAAWQDLFDIEQVLSRTEAVRLVPMR